MQNLIVSIAIIVISGVSALVLGQEGGVKPSVVSGEVASVSETKIVVNAKTGQIDAVISEKTQVKRIPPGASSKEAVAAAVGDINVGDMVTVTGVLSSDGKSLPARAVYLMTKSDLSQKSAKDAAEWRTRGISGKVTTVNPQTGQINVEIRGLMGSTTVVVTPKQDAKYLRYSPESPKFSDAKASSFAEIKPGDNLRAKGDKSADGLSLTAETVLTGSFQTIVGDVVSADVAKNQVVIKDIATSKEITVDLSNASMMKKFPAEMAESMAGRMAGGPGGPQGIRPVAPGGQPTAGQTGQGQGPRPMGPRPGGGGIDEMLERFPNITAADLKAGDKVAIASAQGAEAAQVKAIKLLAGVEPFIRMAQAAQAANPNRGGRGVDFNIPGLDGMGP